MNRIRSRYLWIAAFYYMVRYWMADWKKIVYGNDTSYIKKFTNIGFDGAYLDLYDYKYWETHN